MKTAVLFVLILAGCADQIIDSRPTEGLPEGWDCAFERTVTTFNGRFGSPLGTVDGTLTINQTTEYEKLC